MKKIIAFSLILLTACNSKTAENKAESISQTQAMDSMKVMAASLDSIAVDNKKDPICGMPAKGNVSDTASFEGKLFGFCSTECKNDFLKNPKEHIAAAELK